MPPAGTGFTESDHPPTATESAASLKSNEKGQQIVDRHGAIWTEFLEGASYVRADAALLKLSKKKEQVLNIYPAVTHAGPGAIVDVIRGDGTDWDTLAPIAPGDIDIQTVNGQAFMLGQTDILSITGNFSDRATLEQAIEVGGSRQITNFAANAATGDAYVIQWTDTSGNAHVSTARIIDEFTTLGISAYNFDVQDMVVLTGVPVINQLNFEAIA